MVRDMGRNMGRAGRLDKPDNSGRTTGSDEGREVMRES